MKRYEDLQLELAAKAECLEALKKAVVKHATQPVQDAIFKEYNSTPYSKQVVAMLNDKRVLNARNN